MPKSLRVMVTGANGQVGSELRHLRSEHSNIDWVFLDRRALDLTDTDAIASTIANLAPSVVINCAAYTAVDKAEQEPELADQINHQAVAAIAKAVKEIDSHLIHISTDYVFDGKHYRPYQPGVRTAPTGQYGLSKRLGEEAIQTSGVKGIIIRTSWVYSCFGKNFVRTMLALGAQRPSLNVVDDQIGSPTWARDLAKAVIHVAQHRLLAESTGTIYHYSNSGACSWFDFAKHIMDSRSLPCDVSPIPSEDYPTPAKRPHFSVLDCRDIRRDFGVTTPYWYESLAAALPEFS